MSLSHFSRDEVIDRAERAPMADSREGGKLEPAERAPEPSIHVAHGDVERLAESFHLCGVDLAEASPDDDRLREAPHLADYLDDRAPLGERPPALEHLRRRPVDGGGELRVVTWMEGGLHLPASLAPALTIDHRQAVAAERAHAWGRRTLGIRVGMVLQDVLDVVGMAQQVDVMRAEPHGDDVPIAPRAVPEEAQGIAPRFREDAHERIARGAGRNTAGDDRHRRTRS